MVDFINDGTITNSSWSISSLSGSADECKSSSSPSKLKKKKLRVTSTPKKNPTDEDEPPTEIKKVSFNKYILFIWTIPAKFTYIFSFHSKRKRDLSGSSSSSSSVHCPIPVNGKKCRRRLFSGSGNDDEIHGRFYEDYDDIDGACGSGINKNGGGGCSEINNKKEVMSFFK